MQNFCPCYRCALFYFGRLCAYYSPYTKYAFVVYILLRDGSLTLQLSDSISACKYWCVLPMCVTHIYVYKLFASHLDDFFHIYKLIKFYKIQHMNMAQIMSFEYMYVRRNNLSLSRLCVGHIKPTTATTPTTKTIFHCTHCEFTIFPSPFENIKCYLTYEALDLLAIFTNISRI